MKRHKKKSPLFSFFISFLLLSLVLCFVGYLLSFSSVFKEFFSRDWNSPYFYSLIGDYQAPGAKSSTPVRGFYTLEFGTMDSQAKAKAFIKKLHKKNIKGYYSPFAKKGRVYFRVRAGGYSNKAAAYEAAAIIKRMSPYQPKIISM